MSDEFYRAVVWRSLLIKGTDNCSLWRTAEGWLLKGTSIGVLDDSRPLMANDAVHCDERWRTHRVDIERSIGQDVKAISLNVESRGVWLHSGVRLRDLHGCFDVDLSVTPATNTLPIRRLNLEIGQREKVTAAWVKFPDLHIQPLAQHYTRIGKE